MLKRMVFIVLALASAFTQAEDARYGVHGMALFGGKDGLYAAHLPMFHAPHDVQIVMRVHFSDRRLDSAIRTRLDGKTALWTIDPEKFDLSRLSPSSTRPLAGFLANVVQGHFEQGGRVRYRQAELKVDKVMLYRPLQVDMVVSATSTYAFSVPKSGLAVNSEALGKQVQVVGTVYLSAEDLR